MKIAVTGAGGRMGRTLIEAIESDGALALAAALEVEGDPAIGKELEKIRVTSDIDAAVSAADVLIDFTRPAGTMKHLEACLKHSKLLVIGTTGFSDAERKRISAAAKRIPIVMSPNFAVGVNVLFKVVETAARALGDGYDVEIVEAHHRHKADAPSGTALQLGQIVAGALGRDLARTAVHGRKGEVGERKPKEIGFHAIRGGDMVGDHSALFIGTGCASSSRSARRIA